VIEGDALEVDAPALFEGKPHVVANLPYNVGTALLVGWLSAEWEPWWASLTLMFQKEVAERIVAPAGWRGLWPARGAGAVALDAAKIAMTVHRSAFTPPPKVMSAVVHIVPRRAGGRGIEDAGKADCRGVRPAPQDAAPEPEGRAGRAGGDGNARHRFEPPRRDESIVDRVRQRSARYRSGCAEIRTLESQAIGQAAGLAGTGVAVRPAQSRSPAAPWRSTRRARSRRRIRRRRSS
jgi:hypothetical protein